MQNFKEWLVFTEGLLGSISAFLFNEGRRDIKKLQSLKPSKQGTLFGSDELENPIQIIKKNTIDPAAGDKETCELTPFSGYETHIKAIQSYAMASPENFAQVLLFSPLSANVPFPKHWDNFHVLMMILKHRYMTRNVTPEELEHAVDSFGDYLHSMAHTIGGFKLDTITYVWNNRRQMMSQITALAKSGDDEKLVAELIKIPGVQPVKAGFIAQLLFGKLGCIDTHNIDIYSKAFPDMKDDLVASKWQHPKTGINDYLGVIRKLERRGIATKQLWDVWTDFVENFYKFVSSDGLGSYTDMGSGIDNPDDKAYDPLRDIAIPKKSATTGGRVTHLKPISGVAGMGASATHLPLDPDDALIQFNKLYRKGEKASDAARAVPFRTDLQGRPTNKGVGLGVEPSLLRYFSPAIQGNETDPDQIRSIISKRMEKGGKKAARNRRDSYYKSLWRDFQ